MIPPQILWIPCITHEDDEHIYEGGAFRTEAEAQRVLDIWRTEGRPEHLLAINLLPLYDSVDEWNSDR